MSPVKLPVNDTVTNICHMSAKYAEKAQDCDDYFGSLSKQYRELHRNYAGD